MPEKARRWLVALMSPFFPLQVGGLIWLAGDLGLAGEFQWVGTTYAALALLTLCLPLLGLTVPHVTKGLGMITGEPRVYCLLMAVGFDVGAVAFEALIKLAPLSQASMVIAVILWLACLAASSVSCAVAYNYSR